VLGGAEPAEHEQLAALLDKLRQQLQARLTLP
jgi:hypothetical protein